MGDRSSSAPTRKRAVDPATPKIAMSADSDCVISNPPFSSYPGGKNGMGIYQRIINQMPPHATYIEPFLGSGAVLRRKRPASTNVAIDADAGLIARYVASGYRGIHYVCADAIEWLQQRRPWRGDELIYCDPPYLGEARARSRRLYRCELLGSAGHAKLLRILSTIPAMVMISGYANGLYDRELKDWRRLDYQAMTRGGQVNEVLWMNFPAPAELHDYRYLGRDFHDRCRIGRKVQRWVKKLASLPTLERGAILAALRSPEIHQPPLVPGAASSAAVLAALGVTRGEA